MKAPKFRRGDQGILIVTHVRNVAQDHPDGKDKPYDWFFTSIERIAIKEIHRDNQDEIYYTVDIIDTHMGKHRETNCYEEEIYRSPEEMMMKHGFEGVLRNSMYQNIDPLRMSPDQIRWYEEMKRDQDRFKRRFIDGDFRL